MKQFRDKKFTIIIVVIAVLAVAGIIAAVCVAVSNYRMKQSAAEIHYVPYRTLFTLQDTSLKNTDDVNAIIDLTTYYAYNANITKQERITEQDRQGMLFELEQVGIFPIQSEECRQQAMVLLTLIPDLDFVEYKTDGDTYRRYQQYGEESGRTVFVTESDEAVSAYLENGASFAAFMEQLRPSYESQSISETLGKAILAKFDGTYSGGEFGAEGHTVMSAEIVNGKTRACTVMRYGAYRFINGNFVRIEGRELEPVVFYLGTNDQGNYMLEHIDFANEGVEYEDAVNEMFVKETATRTLENQENIESQLKQQETQQAEAYLKQLGRKSKIGIFADFPVVFLSQKGVANDVVNAILGNEALLSYPMWVGTQEFLEDGKRYVYETSYEEGDSVIVFQKYDYETKEIVEEIKVSATDANVVG